MPYSEQFCYRPKEEPRPKINGTLPARIESREKHDIYSHLDTEGRHRAKLDFSREDTEPGYNYPGCWKLIMQNSYLTAWHLCLGVQQSLFQHASRLCWQCSYPVVARLCSQMELRN